MGTIMAIAVSAALFVICFVIMARAKPKHRPFKPTLSINGRRLKPVYEDIDEKGGHVIYSDGTVFMWSGREHFCEEN